MVLDVTLGNRQWRNKEPSVDSGNYYEKRVSDEPNSYKKEMDLPDTRSDGS